MFGKGSFWCIIDGYCCICCCCKAVLIGDSDGVGGCFVGCYCDCRIGGCIVLGVIKIWDVFVDCCS